MTAQNARKQPRQRAAEESASDPADDVLRIGDEPEESRYEELFKIRGTPYKVLVNPSASLMLRYFDQQRKRGSNAAFSWVLEQMIGAEGYEALLSDDVVSKENFRQIADLVLGILLGKPEALPKSRGNG